MDTLVERLALVCSAAATPDSARAASSCPSRRPTSSAAFACMSASLVSDCLGQRRRLVRKHRGHLVLRPRSLAVFVEACRNGLDGGEKLGDGVAVRVGL